MKAPPPPGFGKPAYGFRQRLYAIIFESDTPAGRRFDIALVIAIMLSIAVVVADSLPGLGQRHHATLNVVEWGFTLLFSAEYLARLLCVRHRCATPPAFSALST